MERVTLRTKNYAMAFGWLKNERMIRTYMINCIEQEVTDAGDSI
jgi:hypothetical protein